MITDISILTIPLPVIWKLQMPTQQKIAVSGIFLLGTFVCGISIARFVFLLQISQGLGNAYDVTYNHAPTIYWTQLEGAFAVISACLPTFRPLFKRHSPGSILSIFRNGKFVRLDRNKKSVGASSVQQSPPNSKDDSSLSSLNKNANDAILESGVEDVRLEPLQDAPGNGIMVQKKFGFQCETV
ncbi:hypothetical protein MMC29_004871 [Sticta canariensis]|nr:hypothetical protein [Sticta canariensis]